MPHTNLRQQVTEIWAVTAHCSQILSQLRISHKMRDIPQNEDWYKEEPKTLF